MASAAEQLAANLNFGAFAKATELKKRILFTLGALIIYRIGTYIPIPGVDPTAMQDFFNAQAGGLVGTINLFSGGALERMSIFALNIMPYISASIIMQLMTAVSPTLEALKKEGESGRKKINQYTRYGTVLLATVQAYALAVGLEGMATGAGNVVLDPGAFFRASTVITIVGGTVFLMWLGEQITSRGVGNGISLIIFAGIVVFGLLIMSVLVITFIVFMERAQRRIIVQYPKRQMGNRMFGGESSHLPLKLNTAGVIPPIFASALLTVPATFIGFSGGDGPQWMQLVAANLAHGQPLFMVLFGALIIFFCFFYTAIVFNPQDTADNLKRYGGFIPGIRPGKNTADYLDFVLTRLTTVGAIYLAFVCLLPELLISRFPQVPLSFGGTSLLIMVTVTMDTVAQIHSHLLAHQYEGLIKKSKLRGRRG